jgi:hypothetical protein
MDARGSFTTQEFHGCYDVHAASLTLIGHKGNFAMTWDEREGCDKTNCTWADQAAERHRAHVSDQTTLQAIGICVWFRTRNQDWHMSNQ